MPVQGFDDVNVGYMSGCVDRELNHRRPGHFGSVEEFLIDVLVNEAIQFTITSWEFRKYIWVYEDNPFLTNT